MILGQMECQPKLNEKYMCFLHCISSFESMYFLPPVFLFYISFYPIKCQQCCPHMETSQIICTAGRLTGFCVGATLAVNGIIIEWHSSKLSRTSFSIAWKKYLSNRFNQTLYPLNGQGLLIKTRVFCWCSYITVLYLFKKKKRLT